MTTAEKGFEAKDRIGDGIQELHFRFSLPLQLIGSPVKLERACVGPREQSLVRVESIAVQLWLGNVS